MKRISFLNTFKVKKILSITTGFKIIKKEGMKGKHMSLLVFIGIVLFSFGCNNQMAYKNSQLSVDKRVEDLLKRMTLEEKIDQLSGDKRTGFDGKSCERLDIPAFHTSDGPLGVRTDHSTAFPAAVAIAATWDTVLVFNMGVALGEETKAHNKNYLLGPCVCIHRMPVGGRNFESYGEDPFLSSRITVSYIKGVQSEKVFSSAKHFALNDQEWERNNVDVICSERAIREIHLPAFEAAVKEAHVWSVMSAYNIVNGQHCSQNYHLLHDILKGDWGFKGFVVSDWVSVYSTEHAAKAGLDLEMPFDHYFSQDSIKAALKDGRLNEEIINEKVRRLLNAKFSIGLFDEKRVPDTSCLQGEKHKQLALKIAQEGIVLLKNDGILPLDKDKIKSIAVIGPNAKSTPSGGGGSSHVDPYYTVSILDGIKKIAGESIKVEYARGDSFVVDRIDPIASNYLYTPDNKQHGLLGEYFNNKDLKGTPLLTRVDKQIFIDGTMDAVAPGLPVDTFSIRWSGKIKPKISRTYKIKAVADDGVRLWINDKLLINEWREQGATLFTAEYPMEAGKEYNIKIEYYDNMGGASMKLGWDLPGPVHKFDMIAQAVELAKKSNVVVLSLGAYGGIESEGLDCLDFDFPFHQLELIEAVCKVNPNTIVLLNGGTPYKTQGWIKNVKAFVDIFYGGQETGNAIADILFGKVNPSGKLPFSFLKDMGQTAAFKGYKGIDLKARYDEGIYVGYRYLDKNNLEPSYPFGFGLSYTSFKYSNIKIEEMGKYQYKVSVDIENIGKMDGDEIVQLYVHEKKPSIDRPEKELKGFSRVNLNKGEKKTITMNLNYRSFAFYDVNKKGWRVDPGEFEILVGASSRDIFLNEKISIK